MQVGHRLVLTNICGERRIHAYVSCTTSGFPTTVLQYAGSQESAYELRLAGTKSVEGCAGIRYGILPIEAVQAALGHRNQLL